jgi:hypothetical protein
MSSSGKRSSSHGFAGRVGSGIYAVPFLPQPEMTQHVFHHLPIVNKGDYTHFTGTLRTQYGVGFPYFLDEFTPTWGTEFCGAYVQKHP